MLLHFIADPDRNTAYKNRDAITNSRISILLREKNKAAHLTTVIIYL